MFRDCEVDALANDFSHGHRRLLFDELQRLVLLRRQVHRRADFLSSHRLPLKAFAQTRTTLSL